MNARWIMRMAAGMVIAAHGPAADGAVLTEPDFEGAAAANEAAWSPFQSDPGFGFDFAAGDQAQSGDQSLNVTVGAMGIFQLFEAKQFFNIGDVVGEPWIGSVWARTDINPLEAPKLEVYLETHFYDGLDGSGNEIGVIKSDSLTGLTAQNTWIELHNVGTIPEEALSARFRLVVFNTDEAVTDSQNVWFDNAHLTFGFAPVPEPSVMGLLLIGFALLRRRCATGHQPL